MDRCAVFVDAGYLYAAGGLICHNTKNRRNLDLDAAAFNAMAVGIATIRCAAPVLRTYWYDGAKRGIATIEQQTIASLPNVKLRLGRLNSRNEQKGVDALIYRDLMTLATERAIADAFLISGDEDLREGVKAAQDRGVRVVLIGIEALKGFNQSRELVEEVDDLVTLSKVDLSPVIKKRIAAPAATAPTSTAASGESSAATVGSTGLSGAARQYAIQWTGKATQADLQGLLAAYPRIPRTLDIELLRETETLVGHSLRGDDQSHRAARNAFWQEVKKAASAGSS